MSFAFDVGTGYFLLGVLALVASLGVHLALRGRGEPGDRTWVAAGLLLGLAYLLYSQRTRWPDWLTFQLAHAALVSGFGAHALALRQVAGQPGPRAWHAAVVACSVALFSLGHWIGPVAGFSYTLVSVFLAVAAVVAAAVALWRQEPRPVTAVIGAAFAQVLLVLLLRGWTVYGHGIATLLAPGTDQVLLLVGGMFAVVLGQVGYLGLQFERQAARRIESERSAAVAAERDRQTRLREQALQRMVEERNRLIQRMAHSEAASDLALFATTLPHELSQPLCASKLSLSVLSDQLARDPGHAGLLPTVRAIEINNERVQDLLAKLRILLSLREDSPREPVDLRALVIDTLPIMDGSFRDQGVVLAAELTLLPVPVQADPTQLQQVLLVLCTHALDVLRRLPREERREVRVSLRVDGWEGLLVVEDSGPPPSEALRAAVDGSRDKVAKGRSGAGLAAAVRVAQKHRGRLAVGLGSLGGCAFTLGLPLSQAPDGTADAEAITPPPRQTSPS